MSTNPLDNQPKGGLAPIFPTAQWLGETQEDLEQQLDQLDCQGDVDPLELMEDGASSPFPTTNSSERSEPVFNAPSKAWINAQISNHLNKLADELSEKVNRVETKLNEAMELIGTQTTEIRQQATKIMQQEAKTSDLTKAKDTAKKK